MAGWKEIKSWELVCGICKRKSLIQQAYVEPPLIEGWTRVGRRHCDSSSCTVIEDIIRCPMCTKLGK